MNIYQCNESKTSLTHINTVKIIYYVHSNIFGYENNIFRGIEETSSVLDSNVTKIVVNKKNDLMTHNAPQTCFSRRMV